jgi:hypothetical protein
LGLKKEKNMTTRRNFLGQVGAGLTVLGWGTRNLFAQMRSGYMMESAPGVETVIDGKTYLYFGGTITHSSTIPP